jgi:hypothetical protein
MGLLDFGTVADSGVKGPYATYSAALAALQADAGAADGDVYELDSGDVYVAQSIGSSFGLIPSKWADQISGDMSNASGSALRIAGESKATTLARGWTESVNHGTLTEVGDALRLDSSTTSNGFCNFIFFPTTGPATSTGVLIAIVLQMVDPSTLDSSAYVEVRDASKARRLALDNLGVAGDIAWHNNQTGNPIGTNDTSLGTSKSVLFIYYPASGEYGSVQTVGDPRALSVANYTNFGTIGSAAVVIQAYNNGGGATKQTVWDLFDVAIWETT